MEQKEMEMVTVCTPQLVFSDLVSFPGSYKSGGGEPGNETVDGSCLSWKYTYLLYFFSSSSTSTLHGNAVVTF